MVLLQSERTNSSTTHDQPDTDKVATLKDEFSNVLLVTSIPPPLPFDFFILSKSKHCFYWEILFRNSICFDGPFCHIKDKIFVKYKISGHHQVIFNTSVKSRRTNTK